MVHSLNFKYVPFTMCVRFPLTSSSGEAHLEAATEDVLLVCVY